MNATRADGLDWDMFMVPTVCYLKNAARLWVHSLPSRKDMTPAQRSAVAALRKLICEVVPDPQGGLIHATEWEWADTSAQHLLDVSAAVVHALRSFGWSPTSHDPACASVVDAWKEAHRVLEMFDRAKRQHHARIDAMFNTEATT